MLMCRNNDKNTITSSIFCNADETESRGTRGPSGPSMGASDHRSMAHFVPLTIVFAAAAYIAGHTFGYSYESKGFISLHRDVSQYNAQRPAFYDVAQLRRFLEHKNKLNTPEGAFLMNSLNVAFIAKNVVLTMPYGKDDVRYLGDKDKLPSVSTGLELTMRSKDSGEQAAASMKLLTDFVIDQMLKQTLTSEFRNKLLSAKGKRQTLDNQLIGIDQNLVELTARLDDTRQIAARYPEAARLNERQLLTTTGESGRFLSPMAQMIGLEADIAALKTSQQRLKRTEQANTITLEFYESLNKRLPTNPTGDQLLNGLIAEIKTHFGETPPEDDVTREVYNNELLLVQSMRTQGLAQPRFTSGPTVPSNRQGLPRHLLLALSLALGVGVAGVTTLLYAIVKASRATSKSPFDGPTGGAEFAPISGIDGSAGEPANQQRRA
ncbi:hypothetical protein [Pandoraea sp. NPDC090278]|uniref:hypothetical protein n=1 Tax=Pandoraea sp. NPDC090278 TaxID=3364391 RepID=UPI003839FC29